MAPLLDGRIKSGHDAVGAVAPQVRARTRAVQFAAYPAAQPARNPILTREIRIACAPDSNTVCSRRVPMFPFRYGREHENNIRIYVIFIRGQWRMRGSDSDMRRSCPVSPRPVLARVRPFSTSGRKRNLHVQFSESRRFRFGHGMFRACFENPVLGQFQLSFRVSR